MNAIKLDMTNDPHDKANLFDAQGRSVLTVPFLEARVAELERENERLRRKLKASRDVHPAIGNIVTKH